MKTLQNDLTTIEQSKGLLELGVPKNSANHYYGKDGKIHYIDGAIPYSLLWETGCIPCWSVGMLIDIWHKANRQQCSVPLSLVITHYNGADTIIEYLEKLHKEGVNFSKLNVL